MLDIKKIINVRGNLAVLILALNLLVVTPAFAEEKIENKSETVTSVNEKPDADTPVIEIQLI